VGGLVGRGATVGDIVSQSGELNLEHLFSDDVPLSLPPPSMLGAPGANPAGRGLQGSMGFDAGVLQMQQGNWEGIGLGARS